MDETMIKKKNNKWITDFSIVDNDGKRRRFQRSLGATRKRDAEREALELFQRLERELANARAQESYAPFSGFAKLWIDTVGARYKKGTIGTYRSCIKTHLAPYFRDIELDAIDTLSLQRLQSCLVVGRSAKTVNNIMGVLSKMLVDARAWNYTDNDPFALIKPLRENTPVWSYWMREESDRFLTWLQGFEPDVYPLIMLALRTGVRCGELRALQWSDIEQGQLHIQRTEYRGNIQPPKSGKSRRVPLSPDAMAALQSQPRRGLYVFLRKDGRMMSYSSRRAIWRRLMREWAKLKGVAIRWHDVRHTFASQMAMAGVSLQKIQALLGHADPKMTLRYAHLQPRYLIDSVATLDGGAPSTIPFLREAANGNG